MQGDAAGQHPGATDNEWTLSDDVRADDPLDRPHEACGVFGIYAPGLDVARATYFGLYALQHRGQESAGIVTTEGKPELREHRRIGLVSQVFTEDDLRALPGFAAIGHTRYSTTGSNRQENVQPMLAHGTLGQVAIGHNGNLTNTLTLRARLMDEGETFETTSDTEVIGRMLAIAPGLNYVDKLRRVMPSLQGSYSLVILSPTELLAVRDPFGVRPLCLGQLNGHWVVASETCALDTIGAQFTREIEPGEIVRITGDGPEGLRFYQGQKSLKRAACLFEYIYFARPDSVMMDRSLYLARQRMGAQLAAEYPVEADLVIGVPDSATPAAAGYAAARGLPYADGLIKNRYIGRTFIQPDQQMRALGVKMKFNSLGAVLKGKRVVMIDDSIVRGTTSRPLVQLLRDAGALEVHLGISSPPFRWPCYLGLDVARRDELIAARLDDEAAIGREIGADSIHYLTLDGLVKAIDLPGDGFCVGCFTGTYPMPVQMDLADKLALEPTTARASAEIPDAKPVVGASR